MIGAMNLGVQYLASPVPAGYDPKRPSITWQTAGKGEYPHIFQGEEIDNPKNHPQGVTVHNDPLCDKGRGKLFEYPVKRVCCTKSASIIQTQAWSASSLPRILPTHPCRFNVG